MSEISAKAREEIVLASEAPGSRSRDAVVIGEAVSAAPCGTVLHKGDDGVYTLPTFHEAIEADPEAEPDPIEAEDAYWDSADAVLLRNAAEFEGEATGVVISRAAEIVGTSLVFPTALAANAAFKATAIAQLANRKIIVR
jgi:hypothetical protein